MIIGITGYKRHGKDTLGKYIVEMSNRERMPAVKIAFADPLKDIVIKGLLGINYYRIESDDEIKNSNTQVEKEQIKLLIKVIEETLEKYKLPRLRNRDIAVLEALAGLPLGTVYRKSLQIVGTDIFRNRNPNFWINLMEERLKNELLKKYHNVIVADIRFPNEAGVLKKISNSNTVIIRINRMALQNSDRHVSEQMVELVPHELYIDVGEGLDKVKEAAVWIWNTIKLMPARYAIFA